MKNIINEMKNTLEGLKSRLNDSDMPGGRKGRDGEITDLEKER